MASSSSALLSSAPSSAAPVAQSTPAPVPASTTQAAPLFEVMDADALMFADVTSNLAEGEWFLYPVGELSEPMT